MRVLSVANQKGGVGKTTSTHNLGVALARQHHKRVLLIDLDAQANLTDSCGVDPDGLKATTYTVLENIGSPLDAIVHLEDNLDILPANGMLSGAELSLGGRIGREGLLKRAIQKLHQERSYDLVLIDCPPTLGLLTVNAFVASDYVLSPIQAEYHALAGLNRLTGTLQEVIGADLNSSLKIIGVFITFYDSRKKLNQGVVDALKEEWKGNLFTAYVRDNVALAEAPSYSKDIFLYRGKSFGGEDYTLLAKELLHRLAKEEGNGTRR